MALTNVPAWLSNLGYPKNGVEDSDALKPEIGLSWKGEWGISLTPGWYFLNNQEKYWHVEAGTVSTSAAVGTSLITVDDDLAPAWGPIVIQGDNLYKQIQNVFSPANRKTWVESSTSNIYYTTYTLDYIFSKLRKRPIDFLHEVSSLSNLNSTSQYYHDKVNRRIYVYSQSDPQDEVYVDFYLRQPSIEIREVLAVEDSQIIPSFYFTENLAVEYKAQTYNASAITSGTVTLPLTGMLARDWVVATYNVPYSFNIEDKRVLKLYTTAGTADLSIDISYEKSVPSNFYAVSSTTLPVTGRLNFNPLLANNFKSGYLFITDTASSYNQLFPVEEVRVSANKKTVAYSFGEQAWYTVLVLGENNLPLPYANVSLSVTGTIVDSYPSTSQTDSSGIMRLRLSHNDSTAVSVTCSGVSGSGTVLNFDTSQIEELDYLTGRPQFVIRPVVSPFGQRVAAVSTSYLDGIPRLSTSVPGNLIVRSDLGAKFATNAFEFSSNKIKEADISVSDVNFIPWKDDLGLDLIPKDKIVAVQLNGSSKVIEVGDFE